MYKTDRAEELLIRLCDAFTPEAFYLVTPVVLDFRVVLKAS